MEADFAAFIEIFKDNYAYLDRATKPWESWSQRYRTAVIGAKSPEAFTAVISSALEELHDFHVEVRSPHPNRWLPVPTFTDVWAEFAGEDALVIAVRGGSDAERAGIGPGDHVIAIGGDPLGLAIAHRLPPAVDNHDPAARTWALLSLLTGRSEEARAFTLKNRNGQTRSVTLPVKRRFDRPAGALSASHLPGNIGLIRFHNSLGDQATVSAFDDALARFRHTAGLILDLRDVPSGGNSSVALGIMGRFVAAMAPYQRHRIPNYGQADVERNWFEQVTPRGVFRYAAPMVVLVDHWTGSMGEGMAIGFDVMRRAVVVGRPMAHLAGAVSEFRLPQTGINLAFPTEQLFHVNGTPRERWLPPVVVTQPDAGGTDAILTRGLAELKKPRSGSGAYPVTQKFQRNRR